MAKLGQLTVQVLIHCVEPFLQLLFCQFTDGVVGGVVIDVGEQYCLRKRGSYVLARTSVAVSASTNLDQSEREAEGH